MKSTPCRSTLPRTISSKANAVVRFEQLTKGIVAFEEVSNPIAYNNLLKKDRPTNAKRNKLSKLKVPLPWLRTCFRSVARHRRRAN